MKRSGAMIIAAYPGAGKSTFASQVDGAIDLPCIPYKRILPPVDKAQPELEPEKSTPYHLCNPLFPLNYIADILKAESKYRFVLIPTNFEVIYHLQKNHGRKVLICHPYEDCREEYRVRFLSRSNSGSFRTLFGRFWETFFDPVWEYQRYDKWGGVYLTMGSGAYLTDIRRQIEEEQQADMTQPVDDETIRAIEEKLADKKKELTLYLSGDASSTESRDGVKAFVRKHMAGSPLEPTQPDGGESTLSPERWEMVKRRERIIYQRDYDPGNYPESGVLRFSRLSIDVVRQLVAENLLDLQDRHNNSPTVGEMLAFCSGEDEAIWFFHGFTVKPEWTVGRVTLEGFESFAALTPERRKEFLQFNRHGETEVSENGACWCWYD